MKHAIAWSILALFVLSGESHAQKAGGGVRIIPTLGSYLPTGDVGYGHGPDDDPASPEFLNLSRGFAVGVAIETPVHSVLNLRAAVKYGFASDLVAGNNVGTESCGTNCLVAAYERTPLTDASALLISTGVAVRPAPSTWVVQPYALGGLAFRRHFYEASAIPAGRAAIQAEAQASRWVPHLGVGAEWLVRSMTLRLEAEMFGDIERDGWKPSGGQYGDAFVSLGLGWTP